MKVKCIKKIGNFKEGQIYDVDYCYIADNGNPEHQSIMELMYSIDDCGYSACCFNLEEHKTFEVTVKK